MCLFQGSSFCRVLRLCARQDEGEAAAHLLEVGRVSGMEFEGGGALVADVFERRVDGGPVDLALAGIDPAGGGGAGLLVALEGEVLDVELDDALAEGANPILRVAVEDDVADVEVGADGGGVELVEVAGELEGG